MKYDFVLSLKIAKTSQWFIGSKISLRTQFQYSRQLFDKKCSEILSKKYVEWWLKSYYY